MSQENVKTDFASLIKAWRERRGYSQEQLAERANLHRTYISDIERASRNPSLESISKLAHALQVSLPVLFSPTKSIGHKNGNGTRDFVDVLLVEDNLDDAELALRAFKKAHLANHIEVVHDGAAALDYLFCRGAYANRKSEHPQMILLDLNLPKISGLEVLRRIKADHRTREVPVVVLTASRHDRDIAECRRLGAETYVIKPLDFQRLSEATPRLNLNWALCKPAEPAARLHHG
jgi:CheY-like chemotaxis protein/DNA-binding phage protein